MLVYVLESGSDEQMAKRGGFMPRKRRFGPNIEGFGLVVCFLLRAYNKKTTLPLMVGALQYVIHVRKVFFEQYLWWI